MPSHCTFALSGSSRWVLESREFQAFLSRYPLAEQTLELFLKHARISPSHETGRINFFLLGKPSLDQKDITKNFQAFLIQLSGFKDPKALMLAMAEAFPAEGTLRIRDREWPLHVVLDINNLRIRATHDNEGRIWIGELSALASLEQKNLVDPKHPMAKAAEWISPEAPIQSTLQPKVLLEDLQAQLPERWKAEVPQNIEGMAWSLTLSSDPKASQRFELAVTGSSASITQVSAWMQRLVAFATSIQGGASQPPEILQESTRVGLRGSFTEEQVKALQERLGLPTLSAVPKKP